MASGAMVRGVQRVTVLTVLLALTVGVVGVARGQQAVQLTVYTAVEPEQLDPYKTAFQQDNPGITINWVRDSTGIITARLIAERNNPRADAVWGLAATSMLIFEDLDMLQPYTPRGAEALKPGFRSSRNPMTWTGMDAWLGVACFNTREAAKRHIRQPRSWKDLANPVYKGQVIMPNPASSGTGYLMVAAWLQLFGEQEGWKFMDQLHQNIAIYLHSGSAPCTRAAQGEFTIGLGFDLRGALLKAQGAPIDIVIMKEGSGWDMEATAIHKGTRNLAAAQRLADFAVSRKAMELYNQFYAITALAGVGNIPTYYPPNGEASMVKNDFAWMAKNRDRILQEWAKRYDSKSAPR